MLSVKKLHYSIDGKEILKDISLDAGEGELIGLIGPNGAGKTSLLKCLNGISNYRGQITVKGTDLRKMKSREIAKHMAFMHQNTVITFPFPALDVVLMGRYPHLEFLKHEGPEDYKKARKYMKLTGTDALEKQPVTRMSGGEFQRVMFAKTLAQETPILLLDEPASNLDMAFEEKMFRTLRELCDNNRTVIAAVHDLKMASRYCTRLVLMKDGSIVADGRVEEVFTSDNLSRAYKVNALVYRNRITGAWDFHTYGAVNAREGKRAHVIGGGGSAAGVTRLLYEQGYKITAGVIAQGDSDLECMEIFGAETITCAPFGEIDQQSHLMNIERIKNADITILCEMPFGMGNIKNLEAASFAKTLVIIENREPSGRDYTGGKALEVYNRLKKDAIIVNSASLHEILPGSFQGPG